MTTETQKVDKQAIEHLRALVDAMDKAFISSWQSTAYWQAELDDAREYLASIGGASCDR